MQALGQHLTRAELEAYGSRLLAAAELLLADRHLSSCGLCRHELRAVSARPLLPELARTAEPSEHLSYEQMSEYLDLELGADARERVEEHALICASCRRELGELRVFDVKMRQQLEAQAVPVELAQRNPVWEWVRVLLASPQRLGYAASGLAAMILGVFTMLEVKVGGEPAQGAPSMEHVVRLSESPHRGLVYGGLVIAAGGLVALVYGLFKKR